MWDPMGRLLASSGGDGPLRLWSNSQGDWLMRSSIEHELPVSAVAWCMTPGRADATTLLLARYVPSPPPADELNTSVFIASLHGRDVLSL